MSEPPENRTLNSFNTNNCIICAKPLTKCKPNDTVVRNPTEEGLRTILRTCDQRKDEVYDLLWPVHEDVENKRLKVSYHKLCRAAYTSKTNVAFHRNAPMASSASGTSSSSSHVQRTVRRDTSGFDIRQHCFICGSLYKRGDKLTQVVTGSGETTRSRVLAAATERLDDVVQLRMLAYTDLFAYDAKYHRTCYAHYISERNIASARNKAVGHKEESSSHEQAFDILTADLAKTVLSKNMAVSNLSTIRSSYIKALSALNVPDAEKYRSWKLKEKLKRHFGDKLVFIERRGLSDIVCSRSMSVGVALSKAALIPETENELELEDMSSEPVHLDDGQILHMAAAVLRNKMRTIQEGDDYVSSLEIDRTSCGDYVPDDLYDFVRWCIDKRAFDNISSCSDENAKKDDIKVISISHSIISQCQKVRTPITLGLGLRVHHDFGSRQLVEELNTLGHSVSYDEIRRFLTSAALDQSKESVFVPHGVKGQDQTVLVDGAIDNFDTNEDTLDGKRTTHAMAAVLYKRCPIDPADCQIPRVRSKSLSAGDAFSTEEEVIR